MGKVAFHVYNLMIFLVLFALNLLALFGAGMSDGGIYPYMWFATGVSFVAWGSFYIIQFLSEHTAWRVSWFLVMIVFLSVWQTGLGSQIGIMIFD